MMSTTTCSYIPRDPVTPTQRGGFGGIIGQSPVMQKVRHMIAVAANSFHPVLIFGEDGSGKRAVARAIRSSGPFGDGAFISIQCRLLAPALFGRRLIDYFKDEFTRLRANGLMATAKGGIVFLDDIEELDLDLQGTLVQLLHNIQNSQTTDAPVDVRIVAATTQDLARVVMLGRFRKDLYCRLNVLSLRLPPLRDHRDDIPLLAEYFLERMMGAPVQQTTISDGAMQAMLRHDWPGNVRELEGCLERACAFASGPLIQVADLPPEIVQARNAIASNWNTECRIVPLAEVERQTILSAVAELNGNKAQAARLLGIGKTTLYRKLQQYESHSVHPVASKAVSRVA